MLTKYCVNLLAAAVVCAAQILIMEMKLSVYIATGTIHHFCALIEEQHD